MLQLGQTAGAFAQLIVSGPGTVFTNNDNVAIGFSGRGLLVVSNGAQGYGASALRLGVNAASSTNNEVIITGANSRWTGGSLSVGMAGNSNTVRVLEGGQLLTGSGYVGAQNASTNNAVIVSDSNSLWAVTADLELGGNSDTPRTAG